MGYMQAQANPTTKDDQVKNVTAKERKHPHPRCIGHGDEDVHGGAYMTKVD